MEKFEKLKQLVASIDVLLTPKCFSRERGELYS